ncbi:MAG: SH3 domain-containing protein [Oscillospiraceae bacterium]|nr:SH3 domain-containing protein [Oscillospiraceae bacterium]
MKTAKKLTALLLALLITASLAVITAEAAGVASGVAAVEAEHISVRSEPGADGAVIARLSRGSVVVVLEKAGAWYRINYNGIVGYVPGRYLSGISPEADLLALGKVTDEEVNMREEPTTKSQSYGVLNTGDILTVLGIENGWYKVRIGDKTGYMRSDYVEIWSSYRPSQAGLSTDPVGKTQFHTPAPPSNDETIALGQRIADYAVQFVGYDYVYGGDSPEEGGFDCSGLVTYVYAQFGYNLYHGSNSQYRMYGVEVAYEDMLPGDLVFFSYDGGNDIAHVGIYLGNDQVVHASDYGVGVIISDLTSDWYQSFYYAAKRIILPEEE